MAMKYEVLARLSLSRCDQKSQSDVFCGNEASYAGRLRVYSEKVKRVDEDAGSSADCAALCFRNQAGLAASLAIRACRRRTVFSSLQFNCLLVQHTSKKSLGKICTACC